MGCCGGCQYLKSPSGLFRLSTVLTGIPAVVLAWIAFFNSSWTEVFPEIQAILAVEKSANLSNFDFLLNEDVSSSSSSSSESDSSSFLPSSPRPGQGDDVEYDIISDSEEDYLDSILLQTVMYEKFFIGVVSVVFVISAAYLFLRVISNSKHQSDHPYEIMFDFIFHVLCALGLLTGSGLVLLSAAKIQSFVDQVGNRDGFTHPEIINIIERNKDTVQDKDDKIAAAVIAMLNGVLYALCVVTIRMTDPLKCKTRKRKASRRSLKVMYPYSQHPQQQQQYNDMPVFSVMPYEYQNQNDGPAYGFYRNSGNASNSNMSTRSNLNNNHAYD